MTNDEQARARLVEIAIATADEWTRDDGQHPHIKRTEYRLRAGFRNPATGSWCAAGLTAAMEDAGLLVPAPGTPARRGAIALLDWVRWEHVGKGDGPAPWRVDKVPLGYATRSMPDAMPGDIIAWLQHPPPDPQGWRRGHVAVIVPRPAGRELEQRRFCSRSRSSMTGCAHVACRTARASR